MCDKNNLIVPVYLNEKTVLDMLAILEDGFSVVSEITTYNQNINGDNKNINGGLSSNALLGKLIKIDIGGCYEKIKSQETNIQKRHEKIHTTVSLLSKFRSVLFEKKLLQHTDEKLDISNYHTGDFIEIEGELQKNPIIDLLEKVIGFYRMNEIFNDTENKNKNIKNHNHQIIKQMELFLQELKPTGTIDFIIKNYTTTLVLTTQEQYLSNDNISEIVGGKFKVLGKIIKICDCNERINLFRKTSLTLLGSDKINEIMNAFRQMEHQELNLPKIENEIKGPSAIILPIAIYV